MSGKNVEVTLGVGTTEVSTGLTELAKQAAKNNQWEEYRKAVESVLAQAIDYGGRSALNDFIDTSKLH